MKKITMGTFDCSSGDIESVASAMKSGFLSTGKEMKTFEELVARYHNKKFGIMVNSGQSAIEAAIEYAKVKLQKKELRIACPATTYAASLWAIIRSGCIPVFFDIDDTYNMDYDLIKPRHKIDVILAVDLCGKTAEPPYEIWDKYYFIEDACESFGNENCSYGDITCFSFYVSHIITTGSGGMVCVESEDVDNWIRSFIAHGRTHSGDFTKLKNDWTDRFVFDRVGVSYRSDNMSAALGLSQFQRLEGIIAKRKMNALKLIEEYEQSEELKQHFIFPSIEYHKDCVFQFFPILIRESSIQREHLLKYLFKKGIDSRVLLSLTSQPAVKELYGNIARKYPVSNYCNKNGFILGCHQNLDFSDMEYIITILTNYVKSSRSL